MPKKGNASTCEQPTTRRGSNMDDEFKSSENESWLNMCCGEPLSNSGKRVQLLKILILTLVPILGLWVFTVYNLTENIQGKVDTEQTQNAVKFSVEVGKFLDKIQKERDMSVLYISILGPQTKTFLMNEYLRTDTALEALPDWPVRNDMNSIFHSKEAFRAFLNEHRRNLDPVNFDIYVEIEFYSFLIERFVEWMYDAIKVSKMASIWKILVSYQKIVTGMEEVGIERALGVLYYVSGGFPTKSDYENYNNKVHVFRSNYKSAVLYSKVIDPVFQKGVTSSGVNLTAVIETFRYEIQHNIDGAPSIQKGQWWFDNMTLYLDTLLIIQIELAVLINGQLEEIIEGEVRNMLISAIFLVVAILMCPLITYFVESLISDIQKYAVTLVAKTNELAEEKKKTDNLLYQMVPKCVADKLKLTQHVDAEYFKSVTVMFSDIFGFSRISTETTPLDIVTLLNTLYNSIDDQLDNYDVYKVETINDSYMVASGLPARIGNRHSSEVAALALDLLEMVRVKQFSTPGNNNIQLRIGINTGPCMAGVVGSVLPRYCLFGDTVNTASRMKSYGLPNKIHISSSTYGSLRRHGGFALRHRGTIQIKGKGKMSTYWLDEANNTVVSSENERNNDNEFREDLPEEIKPNPSHLRAPKLDMGSTDSQQQHLAEQMGFVDTPTAKQPSRAKKA